MSTEGDLIGQARWWSDLYYSENAKSGANEIPIALVYIALSFFWTQGSVPADTQSKPTLKISD